MITGKAPRIKELEKRIERLEKILTDGTRLPMKDLFETVTLSKVIKERIAEGLEENTFILHGQESIYNKAMSLIQSSQQSILSIWCIPGDEPPIWYNEMVEERVKMGINLVRIMNLHIPYINEEAEKLIDKYMNISNFEMYHTEQVTSEALVVDGKYAILTFPTADNVRIESAIYTDNVKLVNAINTWYTDYLMTDTNRIVKHEDVEKYRESK